MRLTEHAPDAPASDNNAITTNCLPAHLCQVGRLAHAVDAHKGDDVGAALGLRGFRTGEGEYAGFRRPHNVTGGQR